MAPTQTCSACRGRKVRCDGRLPKCGSCSKARKPIECLYTTATTVAVTAKGEYLKKGAACTPCRRKKKVTWTVKRVDQRRSNMHLILDCVQKCDALRPSCSTCKVAGKQSECAYEENVERTLTEALMWHTHVLEQRLAAYESQVTVVGDPNSSLNSQGIPLTPSIASSSQLLTPSFASLGPHSVPMFDFPQALYMAFDRPSLPPPAADIHRISAPYVLSGLDEFRATWAIHAPQYGCVLVSEKMQAVLSGDLSATIVHPAFTYLGQLIGCIMWQIQRHMFIFSQVEYEQLQLLLRALEDIDPVSEIQARYLLTIYYLLKRKIPEGEEQLCSAIAIMRRHNIRFPMMSDVFDPLQLQEATPKQVELVGMLLHLVYLDRCSSVVLRVPARLENDFDDELRNVALYYPFLAKTNLTYIRTRSLLLFIRVRDLAEEWARIDALVDVVCLQRGTWFEQYWPLLEELAVHATSVEGEMLKATFYGERERAVALKFCLVIVLAGKAQLHWLPHARHAESTQRALDVVFEIVNVTRTFKDNEFLMLDPLLGICWVIVARILADAVQEQVMPLPAGVSWNAALQTIDASAKKLGSIVPFMEDAVQEISDVVRIVEVS